jgi:sugar phosphate isomerase/epimerase
VTIGVRLGISSYTYAWAVGVPGAPPERPLGAEDLVERAAQLGADVLQIADNLPLQAWPARDVSALAAAARDVGLALELGTRGTAPVHVRRYLELAGALGSDVLRIVVDAPSDEPAPEEVVRRLAPLRDDFLSAGVTLAVENHDRFTTSQLRWIITTLGADWTGICLDTVNSFGALEGPGVVIAALAPLAVNLHVKDFVITRAWHAMGFTVEGCPAGRGRLDIPALLATIGEHRSDLTAVLELWTPPESRLADTIATEDAWARESVAFLRDALGGADHRAP